MSIFVICSIACIARCAFSRSGSVSSSGRRDGTICHDRPNRSLSQPHTLSSPPSVSAFQYVSTSSWVLQSTTNETASVNGCAGPPFSATNRCPSSSKLTVITEPSRPGPAAP